MLNKLDKANFQQLLNLLFDIYLKLCDLVYPSSLSNITLIPDQL